MIGQRIFLQQQAKKDLVSWSTQKICQFVAATLQLEKGKKNTLLDQANKITLDPPRQSEAAQDDFSFIETGADVMNKQGSFEQFLAGTRAR